MSDKKYCIQLSECDGNSKDVYSYDEIEIGTWVDGKPIYRKVIAGKLAKDSGNGIVFANVSDLKIDKVVDLYGSFADETSDTQGILQTSYNRTNGLFAAVNMGYSNATGNITYHYLNNSGYFSGCPATVIIEYTKK